MSKQYLSIKQLRDYLPDNPTYATIYAWTHYGKIPFCKFGKKLFFDKDLIDEWNATGRPAQAL